MSWSLNLFFNSTDPLVRVANEIESLSGLKLKEISGNDGIFYEARQPHFILTLGNHELINDKDLRFEQYAYQLAFWPKRSGDWKQNRGATEEFVRALFGTLKQTGRYPLLLVENVQKKVDEFDPRQPRFG